MEVSGLLHAPATLTSEMNPQLLPGWEAARTLDAVSWPIDLLSPLPIALPYPNPIGVPFTLPMDSAFPSSIGLSSPLPIDLPYTIPLALPCLNPIALNPSLLIALPFTLPYTWWRKLPVSETLRFKKMSTELENGYREFESLSGHGCISTYF
jgi:hypothetical protein